MARRSHAERNRRSWSTPEMTLGGLMGTMEAFTRERLDQLHGRRDGLLPEQRAPNP
jgi:hypothetical protein